MQCLRDHDQINRLWSDPAVLCGRNTTLNSLMWLRVRDLLLTRIGRNDATEH
jgi:hypothetical protein